MPRRSPRRQLRRKRRTREPYERVLIVTEGSQSERIYFEEMVRYYRLSSANIEVVGTGMEPGAVVRKAQETRKQEQRQGEQYDQVYCVFDRDSHPTFTAASDRARTLGIQLARSWPCFEYWLLLHFVSIRQPFVESGGRSACDNCTMLLRRHLKKYRKAMPGLFSRLQEQLDLAKERARQALEDAQSTEEWNPSTEVHQLVEYLQEIKKRSYQ